MNRFSPGPVSVDVDEYETIGDMLRAAVKTIKKNGWFQGDYCDDDSDKVCTIGAINVVTTGYANEEAFADWDWLEDFIQMGIVTWNDDPKRTRKDVIRTLELAAWMYDDTPFVNIKLMPGVRQIKHL